MNLIPEDSVTQKLLIGILVAMIQHEQKADNTATLASEVLPADRQQKHKTFADKRIISNEQ